jgi:hypothetical protein
MSKKKALVLGWTRTGIGVFLPTHDSPDVDETCVGWTRGDHVDAARILAEHGERERDHAVGSWCKRWAKIHRLVSKSGRATSVRAAAETAILSRRRRR